MNDKQRDFEILGMIGYTSMPNYHLRDKNLSNQAIGLLSKILSLPKEWDYSLNGLTAICKDGISSIRSQLKELETNEYLTRTRYQDEKGLFRYKYTIYILPRSEWLKLQNYPHIGFPYTDEPHVDNPHIDNRTQINTNNKKINNKDKVDKEIFNLNALTKNLIKNEYIDEDDSSIFSYNELFENLLAEDNSYRDLLTISNYIISKVKSRRFQDDDGNEIKNRYGYFKNALIDNINRFNNEPVDLWNEDEYDWLNDDSDELKL